LSLYWRGPVVKPDMEPGFIGVAQEIPIPIGGVVRRDLYVGHHVEVLGVCDPNASVRNRHLLATLDQVGYVYEPRERRDERHDHRIVSLQHQAHVEVPRMDQARHIVAPIGPDHILTGMSYLRLDAIVLPVGFVEYV